MEGLVLKLKLQYFDYLMRRADSLEKSLMLGRIEGGRRRGHCRGGERGERRAQVREDRRTSHPRARAAPRGLPAAQRESRHQAWGHHQRLHKQGPLPAALCNGAWDRR